MHPKRGPPTIGFVLKACPLIPVFPQRLQPPGRHGIVQRGPCRCVCPSREDRLGEGVLCDRGNQRSRLLTKLSGPVRGRDQGEYRFEPVCSLSESSRRLLGNAVTRPVGRELQGRLADELEPSEQPRTL